MGKYLITGSPGAGKSTIVRALKRMGYQAYDTESMIGVTKLEDRATNLPVSWPTPPVDWDKYAFNWQRKGIQKLLAKGQDKDVFLAAAVSNQNQYYDQFDAIFVLRADPSLLTRRLTARRKKFGKLTEELRGILEYHEEREKDYLGQNHAVGIDASLPLDKTISQILAYAAEQRR